MNTVVRKALVGLALTAFTGVGVGAAVPASAAPAPFHCDAGLAPGFPDSTGTPTSCVGAEGVPQLMWLDCPAGTSPGWRGGIGLDNYNYNSCVKIVVTSPARASGAGSALVVPAKAARVKVVTVRKGDTLWRIAVNAYGPGAHSGQQYRKIMRLNHLRSTRIHAGQRLRVQ